MGKKFLFMANASREKILFEKVFTAFTKKSFLTDNELYLVLNDDEKTQRYFKFLMRSVFCGTCKIIPVPKKVLDDENSVKGLDFVITVQGRVLNFRTGRKKIMFR